QPGIILTSPNQNAAYRLVPNLPATNQRIEVRALPLGIPNLSEVSFYVDDDLFATLEQPPYVVLWQLLPGQHTFRAVGIDSAGQTWHSPPVQITVVQ
ncbi:MAG: hypothetical protein ACP5Q1_10745, partial [Anaerolineae bacterium]